MPPRLINTVYPKIIAKLTHTSIAVSQKRRKSDKPGKLWLSIYSQKIKPDETDKTKKPDKRQAFLDYDTGNALTNSSALNLS
jgi:hypothetical protein